MNPVQHFFSTHIPTFLVHPYDYELLILYYIRDEKPVFLEVFFLCENVALCKLNWVEFPTLRSQFLKRKKKSSNFLVCTSLHSGRMNCNHRFCKKNLYYIKYKCLHPTTATGTQMKIVKTESMAGSVVQDTGMLG